MFDVDGSLYFPHTDRQGSTIALSSGGIATTQWRYGPYGESPDAVTLPASPSDPQSYAWRYTGQRYDSDFALQDYKARTYSPTLGRFLQPDPAGIDMGPNVYIYVGNDPLGGEDPSGMRPAPLSPGPQVTGCDATLSPGGCASSSLGSSQEPTGDSGPVTPAQIAYWNSRWAQERAGRVQTDRTWGKWFAAGVMLATPFMGEGAAALLAGEAGGESAGVATAASSKPFAMGLEQGVDSFAESRGATTWKNLPDPSNWRVGVIEKLSSPSTRIHFNLTGVDVWGGISRAAAGRGGATDWELLQIRQNPQWWNRIDFWKAGRPTVNPFAR